MSTYNGSEKKHVKSYEELEFTDDFLFCKIMENNVDLCKELTELILNRKIGKIIPKGPQKAIVLSAVNDHSRKGTVISTTCEQCVSRSRRFYILMTHVRSSSRRRGRKTMSPKR